MAKCCGNTCACVLREGPTLAGNHALLVTGNGTTQNPYIVTFKGITFDSDAGDLQITRTFDTDDGYHVVLNFAPGSSLSHIGDVDGGAAEPGQVLTWNGTAWAPAAPVTASSGSVVTDASLAGDGSGATPLAVASSPTGGIETGTDGIKLTDLVRSELVLRYPDSATRDADPTVPVLDQLSMLDSNPGYVDYWDGTEWTPLLAIGNVLGTAYLELSGAYLSGSVTVLVKQLSDTTDPNGVVTLLSADDLAGYAGVLSVTVQPLTDAAYTTGDLTWWMSLTPDPASAAVFGVAFASDGSGEWVSQPVRGIVTAHLY